MVLSLAGLTGAASDQGVEGLLRRLKEHNPCVKPRATEPTLGGKPSKAEQFVGRSE